MGVTYITVFKINVKVGISKPILQKSLIYVPSSPVYEFSSITMTYACNLQFLFILEQINPSAYCIGNIMLHMCERGVKSLQKRLSK